VQCKIEALGIEALGIEALGIEALTTWNHKILKSW